MSEPQRPQYPTLGRYQVIDRIASGGMAEVFLGRAVGVMGFQRLVAIKLIHSNFTRDRDFVNMFIDEARIAMHLHHRNIVQVFDLDSERETYFIAMEYVHGVNLFNMYGRFADQGRWVEPTVALYLVAEIAKGLHFAHTRTSPDGHALGIIHRDISPQNILLSFEGEVKITDFGIATAAERLHETAAGIVKGKYAYMAPERLQEKPVDARADVFSLGVLMYELLAGENPFAGRSAVATIKNVLGKVVPPPSTRGALVGHRLDEICLRALHKDPDQRYPSAHALAHAVTEYAMELTSARKDMASGDEALAALLAELFPTEANTPPEAAVPQNIELPGLAAEPTSREPEVSAETHPVSYPTAPSPLVGPGGAEDYNAPTALRLTPVQSELMLEDQPGSNPGLGSARDPQVDDLYSAPTEPPQAPAETAAATPHALRPPVPSATPRRHDPAASPPPQTTWIFPRGGRRSRRRGVEQTRPTSPASPGHPRPPGPQAARATGSSSAEMSRGRRRFSPTTFVTTFLVAAAVVAAVAPFVIAKHRKPAAAMVPVAISTEPERAFVRIDDQAQDKLTPVLVELRSQRRHVIEFEKPGYQPVRREISPVEGSTVRVHETLVATSGSITVDPYPSRAQIVVNGVAYGFGHKTISDQPLHKSLEVIVELAGYLPEIQQVELTPSQPHKRLTVKLERAAGRRTARRKVTLKAPYGTWAKVYHRGKLLGETTVTAFLPIGRVRLRVKNVSTGLDRTIAVRVPSKGSHEIELRF